MLFPKRIILFFLVLALTVVMVSGCAGTGVQAGGAGGNGGGSGTTPTPTPTPTPTLQGSVNHVLIMKQENRSFDSYFGKMTAYRAANGIPGTVNDLDSGNFSNSGIAPYHSGSVCMENMSPDWSEDHKDVNLNNPPGIVPGNNSTEPMDGFVNTAAGLAQFDMFLDTTGHRAMGFYTEHEINYYYFMAANFAMSDAFFSPVPTNSANNHIYGMGATSQGTVHTPGGSESCPGEIGQISSKPIFQVLNENNISWKVYITDLSPSCDPKNGNFPLDCAVRSTYLQFFTYVNGTNANPPVTGFNPAVLSHMAPVDCSGATPAPPSHPMYHCPAGVTDYFGDVAKGTLPAVAFIESGGFSGRDEHPSGKDLSTNPPTQSVINIQVGAKYVSEIINALMTSPSWKDSVFFWMMDEGGGAFDHVPSIAVPSPDGIKPVLCQSKDTSVGGDFNMTGFRIPNFIVSPFSRKNFVSHTAMDYTAILKFIETRWSLPNLNQRDQSMPDMTEFFDFAGIPWATPPTPPAQTTSGTPCDFTKE